MTQKTRYDKNFEKLLHGAAKVFYAKGYDRASLRDISRETGISLAGIYYYVSGKDEILFHIQRHCFEQVLAELAKALASTHAPEQQLQRLIENHLDFFIKNMYQMKVLSHEAEVLSGGFYREIAALKRRYVRQAQDIVQTILKKRKIRDIAPGTATLCLFGMMNWIYNWYDPKRDGSAKKLTKTMQRIFLQGLK